MSPFRAPGNRSPFDPRYFQVEWYYGGAPNPGFAWPPTGAGPVLFAAHGQPSQRSITEVPWGRLSYDDASIVGPYWGVLVVNRSGLYRFEISRQLSGGTVGQTITTDASVWENDLSTKPDFPQSSDQMIVPSNPDTDGRYFFDTADVFPLIAGQALDFGNIFNNTADPLLMWDVACTVQKVA